MGTLTDSKPGQATLAIASHRWWKRGTLLGKITVAIRSQDMGNKPRSELELKGKQSNRRAKWYDEEWWWHWCPYHTVIHTTGAKLESTLALSDLPDLVRWRTCQTRNHDTPRVARGWPPLQRRHTTQHIQGTERDTNRGRHSLLISSHFTLHW